MLNEQAAKGFDRHRVPAEMRVTGATANDTTQVSAWSTTPAFEPTAYVRADELVNWFRRQRSTDGSSIGGIGVLLDAGGGGHRAALRAKLAAPGCRPTPIHIETDEHPGAAGQGTETHALIFLGMAGLVLLIGVAGILNVGLATVGSGSRSSRCAGRWARRECCWPGSCSPRRC